MLRTDLIDVVNSGRAWAFLGAGASIDAGGPTWSKLLQRTIDLLPSSVSEGLREDRALSAAIEHRQYARAFSLIQRRADRATLERAVEASLPRGTRHGSIITRLADWPFEAYITLNYDDLLEQALARSRQLGWSPVGNSEAELRQLTGGVTKVVWHPHGCITLGPDAGRLVLTEEDYDELYLGETPYRRHLRALLSTRRLVFFGFGFADAEVLRILKELGKLADPTRPIFAVVADQLAAELGPPDEMRARFNVDLVPYPAIAEDHSALKHLVHTHGSFLLRRSLRYGSATRSVPSYDPETTGLLIYNELVLRGGLSVDESAFNSLLRARILSLLESRSSLTREQVEEDIADRTRLLQSGQSTIGLAAGHIDREMAGLVADGLAEDTGIGLRITTAGRDAVAAHAGTSQRLARQFSSSLRGRAALAGGEESADEIAQISEAFLKDCVRRRSLGVAMVLAVGNPPQQEFQIVALLQRLPDFLETSRDVETARGVVDTVRAVLSEPNEAERTYLGLALQAQFGVHLLSLDPDALRVRLRQMSSSAFLVDASTLIPFLARGSVGNGPARQLIDGLLASEAAVGTTPLLVEEVEEHLRWAIGRVGPNGEATEVTLSAALGRAGFRSNAFLEGFVATADSGDLSSPTFFGYLRELFRLQPKQRHPRQQDVSNVLGRSGLDVWELSAWSGFEDVMWAERDELAEAIGHRRRRLDTYTHERQVRAEAEALLTVRNLRNGVFELADSQIETAFFISNTRLIDELDSARTPITMRPEAVLHLLATLRPVEASELGLFTDELLADLEQRGLALYDRARLMRVFAPLVDASREALEAELVRHRELVAQAYGEEADRAYAPVDPLDAPLVLASLQAQRATILEAQLTQEREKSASLAKESRIASGDRAELERLRANEKIRKARGKHRQRSAGSRKRKKKR